MTFNQPKGEKIQKFKFGGELYKSQNDFKNT